MNDEREAAGPLIFVKPAPEMQEEAETFKNSFYAAGERVINGSGGLDFYPDYASWLAYLQRVGNGEEEGFVPSEVWFVREKPGGKVVGVLDIRPGLSAEKYHFGHIGYAVAPAERSRGVATGMVAWGVQQLRRQGVGEILACCYEDNNASRRTLEKNGFTCTGSYTEKETGKTIYQYKNVKEKDHG